MRLVCSGRTAKLLTFKTKQLWEKYNFYQDELVSIWRRSTFTIEAESKEDAIKKIKEIDFKCQDLEEVGELTESEFLFETEEPLVRNEDNPSTLEIEDASGGSIIYSNAW